MEATNRFIESSKRERYSLQQVLPTLKWNPEYKWQHWFTPAEGFDPYDCLMEGFKGEEQPKRFFIEIKLRSGNFDTMVLEKKKLLAMRQAARDFQGAKLLYINVTPIGTYIFDITNIDGRLEVEHLNCNKQTAVSTSNKIDKEVYMIPIGFASRFLPFKFDEKKYQESLILKK